MHEPSGPSPCIPPVRSRLGYRRREPARLHADKGCNHAHRQRLREQGITPQCPKGVESASAAASIRASNPEQLPPPRGTI